jgi:hypothetical protein
MNIEWGEAILNRPTNDSVVVMAFTPEVPMIKAHKFQFPSLLTEANRNKLGLSVRVTSQELLVRTLHSAQCIVHIVVDHRTIFLSCPVVRHNDADHIGSTYFEPLVLYFT